MVQNALRNDWQVQQPAILEADGHVLQLSEEKHWEEKSAGRAEDDQDNSWQNPKEEGKTVVVQVNFSAAAVWLEDWAAVIT